MADEVAQVESKPAKSGRRLAIVIVALLMIGEGAAIYFLTNAISGRPAVAGAGEGEEGDGVAAPLESEFVEVKIAQCRPSNRKTGKTITLKLDISVLVDPAERERIEKMVEAKEGRLLDRVNFVIRSADPKHLDEPGLESIKRRLKHEFHKVFGEDELIKEVLLPEVLRSGSGV